MTEVPKRKTFDNYAAEILLMVREKKRKTSFYTESDWAVGFDFCHAKKGKHHKRVSYKFKSSTVYAQLRPYVFCIFDSLHF